jgi:hypothetical protein
VISKDLFLKVQDLINTNRLTNGHAGGKTGIVANLFSHTAKCGLCGASMRYQNKGSNWTYLVCDSAFRGIGGENKCKAKPINYDEFQESFFANFDRFDIKSIFPEKSETDERISNITNRIEAIVLEIKDVRLYQDNLRQSIQRNADSRVQTMYEADLIKLMDKEERLISENAILTKEKADLSRFADSLETSIKDTKQIYGELLDSPQDVALRLKVRQQIRKLITEIKVYPQLLPYAKIQKENPYQVRWMDSKSIDKITIRYAGSKEKMILLFSGVSDLEE